VVIIFQENRSTDNLFHNPVLMNRGADIATQGLTSTGQMVALTPVSLLPDNLPP
jgi:phospholipase C